MNYIEKLNAIRLTLNNNGYQNISDTLSDRMLAGSTGGEVFSIACSTLMGIEDYNYNAYILIKNDIEELINYANRIGYFPLKTSI